MSTPQWFAEFERQEAMREERLDEIRARAADRRAADDNSESARKLRRLIARLGVVELLLHDGWTSEAGDKLRAAIVEAKS